MATKQAKDTTLWITFGERDPLDETIEWYQTIRAILKSKISLGSILDTPE